MITPGLRRRIERLRAELLEPAREVDRAPVELTAWMVPGEPVAFAEAVTARYEPFAVGRSWGAAWSTLWLHVTAPVPAGWRREARYQVELVTDLGFSGVHAGGQAEGLVFRPDGSVVKGLEPFNRHVPVDTSYVDLYLELAANPGISGAYAPTPFGSRDCAPPDELYRLERVELVLRDAEVDELIADLDVLSGLAEELADDDPRASALEVALHRAVDAVVHRSTTPGGAGAGVAAARALLEPVLDRPAHASAHRVVATGHAHIDSAWLWPLRETVRKVARTFANVLDLMDSDESLVFAASSAQHYAWLEEGYPTLWRRLRERVAQGRFVPVGGMWVEADTNLPGSEALARQFVLGGRYFAERFGIRTGEVWLPDSFGYSAALPQIARAAGARWLLTQKPSWNDTNRMPFSTFDWQGIDGSRILVHLPPADTYESALQASDLLRAQRQYRGGPDGTMSLIPFGHGDGGGGPTREMLARARRSADLEGLPRVSIATPEEFYRQALAESPTRPVWTGEMYLEKHRGTYTSQLRTKQGVRRSEHALRAAELWSVTAAVRLGWPYPAQRLRECWRTVALCAFHDILPGSSIAWVHRDVERMLAQVLTSCAEISAEALAALTGSGTVELTANPAPVSLCGVGAFTVGPMTQPSGRVVAAEDADGITIDNGLVRVRVDRRGLLVSVVDLVAGRELVPHGLAIGLLQLHDDRPGEYEAWDIDPQYRDCVHDLVQADEIRLDTEGGRAAVHVRRRVGRSSIEQTVVVVAGSRWVDCDVDLDWQEERSLLKLAFPVDLLSATMAAETQFGVLNRPTHANTSWDQARFETCAHRFVHLDEGGYGVAVANDSTYGHDVTTAVVDGRTATCVRLSLVRGPRYPDPDADRGRHTLAVSLGVGVDLTQATVGGRRLNEPVRTLTGAHPVAPVLTSSNPAVLVEAVKLAEDGSGDVVLRLYEAIGRRCTTTLRLGFAHGRVLETDLLEEVLATSPVGTADADEIAVPMHPFQIRTLRVTRAS